MSPSIVLSYRRNPTLPSASRIFDHLKIRLGSRSVFMDVSSVPPGAAFMDVIEAAISKSAVLLIVIGPGWTGTIQNENDYVRREIHAAIVNGVSVIPVIVDSGRMPELGELPEELAAIAAINAISVRHTDFEADMARLIDAIHPLLRKNSRSSFKRLAWFAVFIMLIGGAAGVIRAFHLEPVGVVGTIKPGSSVTPVATSVYCVIADTFVSSANAARQLEFLRRDGYGKASVMTNRSGQFVLALDCVDGYDAARSILTKYQVKEGTFHARIENINSLTSQPFSQ